MVGGNAILVHAEIALHTVILWIRITITECSHLMRNK